MKFAIIQRLATILGVIFMLMSFFSSDSDFRGKRIRAFLMGMSFFIAGLGGLVIHYSVLTFEGYIVSWFFSIITGIPGYFLINSVFSSPKATETRYHGPTDIDNRIVGH